MKVPPRRIFLPAGPFYKKFFTPCPFPRQPLRLAGAIYNPPGFLWKGARGKPLFLLNERFPRKKKKKFSLTL